MSVGGRDPSTRELSGLLSSDEKWEATWRDLATPGCPIRTLKVMHNTEAQAAATAAAMASGGGVAALEVGELGERGAAALAEALQVRAAAAASRRRVPALRAGS
jgi:hypothetical protein